MTNIKYMFLFKTTMLAYLVILLLSDTQTLFYICMYIFFIIEISIPGCSTSNIKTITNTLDK